MKKSQKISLVLISALLASCHEEKPREEQELYVRADATASYSHAHHNPNMLLWYMAFHSYGTYNNGVYRHTGMYNNAIPHSSNVGRSATKTTAISTSRMSSTSRVASSSRGGFGHSSFHSSAS